MPAHNEARREQARQYVVEHQRTYTDAAKLVGVTTQTVRKWSLDEKRVRGKDWLDQQVLHAVTDDILLLKMKKNLDMVHQEIEKLASTDIDLYYKMLAKLTDSSTKMANQIEKLESRLDDKLRAAGHFRKLVLEVAKKDKELAEKLGPYITEYLAS